MKKLIVIIPLIFFISFIDGCGDGKHSGFDNYYPLTVGNVWNYRVTMTCEEPGTTYVISGDLQSEITDETQLVNGTDVFEQVIAWTLDGSSSADTNYIEETNAAIFSYDSKDDTYPDKILGLPIEDGGTWDVNITTTAVVVGRKDVVVPAGCYDCWEIAYIMLDDTTYVYFAENVGDVREYGIDTEDDITITAVIELESATIQ